MSENKFDMTSSEIDLLQQGKVNDVIKSIMNRIPCGMVQAAQMVDELLAKYMLQVVSEDKHYIQYQCGLKLHRLVA